MHVDSESMIKKVDKHTGKNIAAQVKQNRTKGRQAKEDEGDVILVAVSTNSSTCLNDGESGNNRAFEMSKCDGIHAEETDCFSETWKANENVQMHGDEAVTDDIPGAMDVDKWNELLGTPADTKDIDIALDAMIGEQIEVPIEALSAKLDAHVNEMTALRKSIADQNVAAYLDELKEECEGKVLLVGSMNIGDIEHEEKELEKKRIRVLQDEAQTHRMLAEDIAKRELVSKRRILEQTRKTLQGLRLRDYQAMQRHAAHLREQQIAFRHAESRLEKLLRYQQGALTSTYGELQRADDVYGAAKTRVFRVQWMQAPRPVQLGVHTIRALKNKVLPGLYVVMVTLYDRLGGVPLRWSKLDSSSRWNGVTPIPQQHTGKFHEVEMRFDQPHNHILLACPAQSCTRPSMVFIFELIRCGSSTACVSSGAVVGWGAFPVSTPDLEVISGKFKVPLLRGPVDQRVVKYDQIEKRISNDLDVWLANLYFDVHHLPRKLKNQAEFEVVMNFSGQLARMRRSENARGEIKQDREEKGKLLSGTERSELHAADEQFSGDGHNSLEFKALNKNGLGSGEDSHLQMLKESLRNADDTFVQVHRIPDVNETSVIQNNDKQAHINALSSLSRAKQLVPYQFHLTNEHDRDVSDLTEKMVYIKSELMSDLSLNRWRTMEFWAMVTLLAVVFWFRIYPHYLAEWAVLQVLNVPVLEFDAKVYTVNLVYPTDSIDLSTEMIIVISGPLFNFFLFMIWVAVAATSQLLLETFPHSGSHIVFAFGLAAVMDPVIVLIVDICTSQWSSGDAFKLYRFFEKNENSGVPGVFLTCFMYVMYMSSALFVFYIYLLRIHLNGRMLDVFRRLHGSASSFFIPDDMEISLRNLRWIVNEAKTWTGFSGSSRKIASTVYITRDHLDSSFEEKTIHLCIYTQSISGERELFRHFLRRDDGTILELFDEQDSIGESASEMMKDQSQRRDSEEGELRQKQILSELLQQEETITEMIMPSTEKSPLLTKA